MRTGKAPLPVPTEATKLIRLYRVALDRRGDLPNSIEKREIYLRAFARYLDSRGLMEATRQDIELFLDKRRTREGRKLGDHTRYLWLAHFHSFYKWAVLEELIEVDPTVAIVRPKTRRTLPCPIGGDDLILAIRAARPDMRAMLSLAAFAGLRCQEIAGLDRDDVIEAKGLIRVRHGKGAKERIVPLHPDVMEALRCLPLPRSGAIFVRPRGGRYSPNWLSACCSRYLHELGINATAHQCRHWFATEVYGATHDIRVTQELLGHQSLHTTAGYIAYSHVDAAAAVGALKLGP
jgi:integrase/recombinase XerC